MKKLLFVLSILGLVSLQLFADDTIYGLRSGALVQITEKHPSVYMLNEVINIDAYESYYEVSVDFLFYNDSKAQELTLGFPVTEFYGNGTLYDFEFQFNGKTQQRNFTPIAQNETELYKTRNAYTIPVTFEPGLTTTKVKYKNSYGTTPFIGYYYGSGAAWKGKIQSVELYLTNHTTTKYIRTDYETKLPLEIISDNTLYGCMKDVSPDPKDCFGFIILDFATNRGKKKPDINSLKPGKNEYYTKSQYRILRNTIYAAHGYTFKSEDLSNYFSKASWYKINPSYSDAELSIEEKDYIEKLRQTENNWPSKNPQTPKYIIPATSEIDSNPYRINLPDSAKNVNFTTQREKNLYPLTLTTTKSTDITWDSIEPMCKYPKEDCLTLTKSTKGVLQLGNFTFYYNPESTTPEKGLLYLNRADYFLCINYDINNKHNFSGHSKENTGISDKDEFILLTKDSNRNYCILSKPVTKNGRNTSQIFIYDIGDTTFDQMVYYNSTLYINNTAANYCGYIKFQNGTEKLCIQEYNTAKKVNLYILSTETYYDSCNVFTAEDLTTKMPNYLYSTEYYRGGDGRGQSDYVYHFFLASTDEVSKKPEYSSVLSLPDQDKNTVNEKIEKIYQKVFATE